MSDLTLRQRVMLAMEIADPFYVNAAHADAAITVALEESARVAEEFGRIECGTQTENEAAAEAIAAAIRSLIPKA